MSLKLKNGKKQMVLTKEHSKIRAYGKEWNHKQRQKYANYSAQEILDSVKIEGKSNRK